MAFASLTILSLLTPAGCGDGAYREIPAGTYTALGFEPLVARLARGADHLSTVGRTDALDRHLRRLPVDARVARYRAEIIADLRRERALAVALDDEVRRLAHGSAMLYSYEDDVLETVGRLSELEFFVERVRSLQALFESHRRGLRSEGLRALAQALEEAVGDPVFDTLADELPRLRAGLQGRQSVTLGINLDEKMLPRSATLLSINSRPFSQPTSLQRVLGVLSPSGGAAPLHTNDLPPDLRGKGGSREPLMPLFQDVNRMLRSVVRPIASSLRAYASVQSAHLFALAAEIGLLLRVVELAQELESRGLPVTTAKIDDSGASTALSVSQMYTIDLALGTAGDRPVLNDVTLDENEKLVLITGPNSGGKTTFVRAVAQVRFLAQQGFPVPAAAATVPVAPAFLALFASADAPAEASVTGRLERELQELADMLGAAPRDTLFVFNEAFSSTGSDDALDIARSVIKGLVASGSTVFFVTHLHALAHHTAEIEAVLDGARVVNLVAGMDEGGPTYRVERNDPDGKSHAARLIQRFRLDAESIAKRTVSDA